MVLHPNSKALPPLHAPEADYQAVVWSLRAELQVHALPGSPYIEARKQRAKTLKLKSPKILILIP